MRISIATMIVAVSCWTVEGFSPAKSSTNRDAFNSKILTSTTCLYAGGFGGGGMGKKGGNDKKKNTSKETKLKPKQQWDRYSDFKREPKIQVGVRIKDDGSDEWLEVGRVKSKDSQYTEFAVFRQRGVIADVSNFFVETYISTKDSSIKVAQKDIFRFTQLKLN